MVKVGIIWFILYVVFGIYFINSSFNFVSLPDSFSTFDSWIIFIGGILILWGGINHWRASRYSYHRGF